MSNRESAVDADFAPPQLILALRVADAPAVGRQHPRQVGDFNQSCTWSRESLRLDPSLIHHPNAVAAGIEPVGNARIDLRYYDAHRPVVFQRGLFAVERREPVTVIHRI